MQSMRRTFFLGAPALVFVFSLLGATGPAMAGPLPDGEVLCDALEQARDPLYEVPMGTEDWPRINALENAARAIDCAFMINE
ncbi:hypothetical protein D9O50_05485 [Oxalobacteraceae bacterium CAVE-383]|nr:hypothetical protein D9O50_05485 [Oxalobacteraceae bacterium CAVE-383]